MIFLGFCVSSTIAEEAASKMDAQRQFRLGLIGVFRLAHHGRGEIQVSSRKARALLAVLALAPQGERSRVWLQDMLWSRSDRSEAQGSLRRELSSIRHILGDLTEALLEVRRETIRLRLEHCDVDTRETGSPSGSTLLEGLDLPGAEGFEEWLRTERQRERPIAAGPSPAAGSVPSPATHLLVTLHLDIDRSPAGPVGLVPDMVAQAIAAGLSESGFVRASIIERQAGRPTGPTTVPDIELHIRATAAGDASWVVVVAHRFSDGALMMSRQEGISTSGGWAATNSRVGSLANQCVDQLLREALLRPPRQDQLHMARRSAFAAVEQMFSLNPADVTASRETWSTVREYRENGIFNAWQAYQAVFLADPGHGYNYRLTLEECRENLNRALAQEPYNGLVLSLCAHVEAFLFRDFSAAWDLIDRAGLTGTRHVMYYDALSLLRFYSGRYDEARESATAAMLAGRNLSYRYAFATTLLMIEGLAGNHQAAIAHGRRALQLEPANRRLSYPPILRYLGATLAHSGQLDEARSVLEQLPEAGRLAATSNAVDAPLDALPSASGAHFVKSALRLVG